MNLHRDGSLRDMGFTASLDKTASVAATEDQLHRRQYVQ
jgi:hypothetical protein